MIALSFVDPPSYTPSSFQADLESTLSSQITQDSRGTVELVSVFVWLTFMHIAFQELPVLWLYTPSPSPQQSCMDLIRQLASPLPAATSQDACCSHTPTGDQP